MVDPLDQESCYKCEVCEKEICKAEVRRIETELTQELEECYRNDTEALETLLNERTGCLDRIRLIGEQFLYCRPVPPLSLPGPNHQVAPDHILGKSGGTEAWSAVRRYSGEEDEVCQGVSCSS